MIVKAALVLADGKVFEGSGFGACRGVDNPAIGEVVFNTSMYGYQEILSDPSYAGQIMCFSYPHIGNVGCNALDDESDRVHVAGVICRNLSERPSCFRSEESFEEYLSRSGVMGLSEVDTRELVIHLRDNGAQMGAFAVISSDNDISKLQEAAIAAGTMAGKEYVSKVSCAQSYDWNELPWNPETNSYPSLTKEELSSRPHCVVVDCGVKRNILRLLTEVGFRITVVPANSTVAQIRELAPDGLFLSNGPGDPATLGHLVDNVRELVGSVPIFGICLGHQVLAQALGATTFKLKFGHRGCNHPIQRVTDGKVEIAAHNHGFAVSSSNIPEGLEVTHLNLNDNTIAGIENVASSAFSVQYHPEASSGPHDSLYLFGQFFELVQASSNAQVTYTQVQPTFAGEKNA